MWHEKFKISHKYERECNTCFIIQLSYVVINMTKWNTYALIRAVVLDQLFLELETVLCLCVSYHYRNVPPIRLHSLSNKPYCVSFTLFDIILCNSIYARHYKETQKSYSVHWTNSVYLIH